MPNDFTLARLQGNDPSLTTLTIVVRSKLELADLLASLQKNTMLIDINLRFDMLMHGGLMREQTQALESTAQQIRSIVHRNDANARSAVAVPYKLPTATPLSPLRTRTLFGAPLQQALCNERMALAQPCAMSNVTQPLSKEDITFLRSHTVAELVGMKEHGTNLSLKSLCIELLAGIATSLATAVVVEAVTPKATLSRASTEPDPKPGPTSSTAHPADATKHTSDKSSMPAKDSAKDVTAAAAKKQVKKISIGEFKRQVEIQISKFPEHLPLSQAEADQLAKDFRNGFQRALTSAENINKLINDPSREQLGDITMDYVKGRLINYMSSATVANLPRLGNFGIKIVENLSPVMIVVNGILESHEIDPQHHADQANWYTPVNLPPGPPAPAHHLDPLGPSIRTTPSYGVQDPNKSYLGCSIS